MANYRWEFEATGAASVNSMAAALNRLEESLRILQDGAKRAFSGFERLSDIGKRASDSNRQAASSMQGAAGAAGLFQNAMAAAASSSGGFTGALLAGAQTIPVYGEAIGIAAAAVGKLKSAFDAIVAAGAPVESVRNELQALLPAGNDGAAAFGLMKAKALELSGAMGVSQEEIFKTFSEMLKGGASASQALERIPTVLKMATAESLNAVQASKNGAIAWNIYGAAAKHAGMSFEDMQKTIISAANAGNISDSSEIVRGLKTSGEAAKSAGMKFNELMIALTMLSNAEFRGAEGGNKLKAILLSLTSDTAKTRDVMRQVGVTVTDSGGKVKPFVTLLGDLQAGFGKLSQVEKLNLSSNLVGKENLAAFLALLSQGAGEYTRIQGDLIKGNEQLSTLFNAQANTQAGAMGRAASAWQNLLTVLDEIIARPVAAWWNTVSGAVSAFTGQINTAKEEFLGLVAKAEAGGANPLTAWFAAFEQMDWSAPLASLTEAFQPVIDMAVTLLYRGFTEFAKFAARSTPRLVIETLKVTFNTAVTMAKEAALAAMRFVTDKINAVLDGVKNVWKTLTGQKLQPVKVAALNEQVKPQAKTGESIELEIDKIEQQNAALKEQKPIMSDLQAAQQKRLDALKAEQQARAAILQQMNASLTAESALQLAGTSRGQAMAERYQAEQQRKDAAAKADRAKAVDIQRASGPTGTAIQKAQPTVGFDAAMRQAQQERLRGEGLDAISSMLASAQRVQAADKAVKDTDRKLTETKTQIANAPIDADMQANALETATKKWLLNPLDEFKTKIMDIFQKFGAVFEGLGKKRIDVGVKSGRLDAEGAKREQATLLESSVTRAQKLLQLAQSPEQKAAALEQQADKLTEFGDVTGDKSKFSQADKLLQQAAKERGKQEQDELKAVEYDRQLAKKNIASLEGKQDSSASEAVARFTTLLESYKQVGDVRGVMQTKGLLQQAQQQAAGESVSLLKGILNELQLQRKVLGIESEKTRLDAKDNTLKQVDILRRIKDEGGGYDPAYATP